jgi:hypothetical protein
LEFGSSFWSNLNPDSCIDDPAAFARAEREDRIEVQLMNFRDFLYQA